MKDKARVCSGSNRHNDEVHFTQIECLNGKHGLNNSIISLTICHNSVTEKEIKSLPDKEILWSFWVNLEGHSKRPVVAITIVTSSVMSNARSRWGRETRDTCLFLYWYLYTNTAIVINWKHFPRYWPFVRGPRWIPRTKASDAELWCLLWSAPE